MFDISVDQVKRLNQFELTDLMNKLMRTEITKTKLRQSGLKLSLNVLAGDEGLDASLTDPVPEGHEWLPEGLSGWQFKAEDIGPTALKKDVLGADGKLTPLIEDLLQNDGTYVLVVGQKSYNHTLINRRVNALKEVFKANNHPDAKIVIYSSSELVEWINQHPNIIAHLNPDRYNIRDMSQWFRDYPHIRNPPFVIDSNRAAISDEIRTIITSNYQDPRSNIIRIVGLAGIGKTRLIFEALNVEGINELVIFIESPDKLPRSLFNEIAERKELAVTIVVDECPNSDFLQFAKEAEGIGGRLTLITLDFDIDTRRALSDNHYEIKALTDESIKMLVGNQALGIPDEVIDVIVEYSEGYPRFAVLLTETYTYAPEAFTPANIHSSGAEGVYERLIQGRKSSIDPVRIILRGISLFKRIGWDGDKIQQGQYLCDCLGIKWEDARSLIHREIERGLIVKRGDYIYITPRPLADYLASTWWAMMDFTTISKFYTEMPDGRMSEAFVEKIPDIPESENVEEFQRRFFLGFTFETLNHSFGSRLFLELTKSSSKLAVESLERILGPLSKEELLTFDIGRSNILWALQMILWWPKYYSRGIQLLLKLSLAETQTYSNNATNIFKDSFKPILSGTSVSLNERVAILDEIVNNYDYDAKLLVIDAISNAFSSLTGTHRNTGSENQGIKQLPPEWYPANNREMFEPLESMITLIDSLRDINLKFTEKTLSFYSRNSRTMIKNGFGNYLINGLNYYHNSYPTLSYKTIISTIENIMAYEKDMPDDIEQKLVTIKNELINDTYESRINRYVKIKIFQDRVRENKEERKQKLNDLAKYSIDNPNSFNSVLEELVTTSSENSYDFGYSLSKYDTKQDLYESIRDATINSNDLSVSLLGGYLNNITSGIDLWSDSLNYFVSRESLNKHVIDLIWMTKGSDKKTDKLMFLLSDDIVKKKDVIRLLYGGWFLNTSKPKMNEFLIKYYELYEGKIDASMVDIVYQYFRNVGHDANLFTTTFLYIKNENSLNTKVKSVQHAWHEVCLYLLNNDSAYLDKILDLFILAVDMPILDFQYDYASKIIRKCITINVETTWTVLSNNLRLDDKRAYKLMAVLRGNQYDFNESAVSILDEIPIHLITNWVDKNPKINAVVLARITPLKSDLPIFHPLAEYILTNYSKIKYVENELSANLFTEGFSGSSSQHYAKKKNMLDVWLINSKGNVTKWIQKEIDEITTRIQYELKKEEEFDLY